MLSKVYSNSSTLGIEPEPHLADDFVKEFGSNARFRAVMSRLFYENGGLEEGTKIDLWKPQQLTWTDVGRILGEEENFQDDVYQWTDEAKAFCDSRGVGFFAACHFDRLRDHLYDPERPDPLLQLALRGTIGGWDGHGSAGTRIEKYLQERYALDQNVEYESRKLTFTKAATGQNNFRLSVNDPTADTLTLAQLHNVLFDVSSDQGLDGFIVEFDAAANVCYLDVLQVKTGQLSKSITVGGLQDERRENDRTMRGVLAKAKRGAENFRGHVLGLYKNAEAPQLVFRSFTLITTKKLNKAAKEKYFDKVAKVQWGDDFVDVFVISSSSCFDLMQPAVQKVVDECRK